MQWISDLIKHITISKSLTFAALVTSCVLVFGPVYFPQIEQVPKEWRWAFLGIIIFTFTLCLWWAVESLTANCERAWLWMVRVMNHPRISKLSKDEKFLLEILGYFANDKADLNDLVERKFFKSMLELLDLSKKLQRRGLVAQSYRNNENYVSLTQNGRVVALRLLAEKAEGKNEST